MLAFLEPGDEAPEDAVVVIRHPRLSDGQLSYAVESSKASCPTSRAGDAVHRPLRAAALTGLGMRRPRRERRRMRRRI